MANLTPRNDPFQELSRFDPFREMESLFGFPRLRRWLAEAPAEPHIKLDVSEDDKAYHVKADLPGVKKEDIGVEIEGHEVSLTAEVKGEKEEKRGESVVHSERYYGKQFRSFTLAHEIDRDRADAKFADGVLELTLPKKDGVTGGKRVPIH